MAQTYRIDRSDRASMTPAHPVGQTLPLALGALIGFLLALGAVALLAL